MARYESFAAAIADMEGYEMAQIETINRDTVVVTIAKVSGYTGRITYEAGDNEQNLGMNGDIICPDGSVIGLSVYDMKKIMKSNDIAAAIEEEKKDAEFDY